MAQFSTFPVSAAGMSLERTRVEIATLNLANAHTTAAAGQASFVPLRVVASASTGGPFAALMGSPHAVAAGLAPAYRIEPAMTPARKVHEPGHPLADGQGFVTYPGVDSAAEMVTLLDATRAYEANVAAMNTARTLALKSLDIGGTS